MRETMIFLTSLFLADFDVSSRALQLTDSPLVLLSFHFSHHQAAALASARSVASAGAPEQAAPPRSRQAEQHRHHLLLRRQSSPQILAASSPSPSHRPSVAAAASSTQVDRDHTAASMDSSRGQALVAWLEVRRCGRREGESEREIEERETRGSSSLFFHLDLFFSFSYPSSSSSLLFPLSNPFPSHYPPTGQRRPAAEGRAPRGRPRGATLGRRGRGDRPQVRGASSVGPGNARRDSFPSFRGRSSRRAAHHQQAVGARLFGSFSDVREEARG